MNFLLPLSLLLAASCTAGNSEAPEFEFSEAPFEVISLSRVEVVDSFGFCPQEGTTLSATVTQSNGAWILESVIAVAAPAGTAAENCINEDAENCLVAQNQAPLSITPAQLESLRDAVATVPGKQCETNDSLVCEFCLVTSINVDGNEVDDFCCGDLNENFSERFRGLEVLLDSLASEARENS